MYYYLNEIKNMRILYSILFFFFWSLSGHSRDYGGSQAMSQIGAIAADLCQSHSSVGSELRVTPQLMAMTDP